MGITKVAAVALRESQIKKSEHIDAKIRGALRTISENPLIKPTQSKLAELSDCHLSTLREREWPLTKLKEIKVKVIAKNRIDSNVRKQKAKENRKKLVLLNDKLSDEILYWFDRNIELKVKCEALEYEVNRYKKSSDLNLQKVSEYRDIFEKISDYMSDIHEINLEKLIKNLGF